MKKKFLGFLIAFLITFNFFAYDGVMSGEKKLKVIQTKWFDIIFAEKNLKTARLLSKNADSIYEEVTAQYFLEPEIRMPVVISTQNEVYNANWTCAMYNHIVLYDTGTIDEVDTASDTFLNTFKHEVTHAVTYNMKNGFWKGVDTVLGDAFYPGAITVTAGMAEGAAVTSESALGEGRLNSGFAMHMVDQAAIEKDFPDYYRVQGASDVNPLSSYYFFNGAFQDWIQKKYGMEKYAKFWYRLVNFKSVAAEFAFKRVYGIKLSAAWKEFARNYGDSELAALKNEADPVAAGRAEEFLKQAEKENQGALYTSLCAAAGHFYFMDTVTDSVFASDSVIPELKRDSDGKLASDGRWISDSQSGYGRKYHCRKLFTLTGLKKIRLSADGRYLTLLYTSTSHLNSKACLKIYDTKLRRFTDFSGTNIHDGIISGNFLILKRYESPVYKLEFYRLKTAGREGAADESKITGFEKIREVEFPLNCQPEELASAGSAEASVEYEASSAGAAEGASTESEAFASSAGADSAGFPVSASVSSNRSGFAFILKNGMKFSVVKGVITDCGVTFKNFVLPPDITEARGLSWNEGKLAFAWTKKGSVPGAGILNPESGNLKLYEKAVSGGIFNPVLYDGKLAYVGKFYRQNRLLVLNQTENDWREEKVVAEELAAENEEQAAKAMNQALGIDQAAGKVDSAAEKIISYNPFKYYLKGLLLPLSVCTSYSYNTFHNSAYSLPYGLTYISTNPWTGGKLILSSGYGWYTDSIGISVQYSGGSTTPLFTYTLGAATEFDSKGWKQVHGTGTVSSTIPMGNISRLIFSDSLILHYGRSNLNAKWRKNNSKGSAESPDTTNYFYEKNQISAGWSNIHQSGTGRYSFSGLNFTGILSQRYNAEELPVNKYKNYFDAGALCLVRIPRLIPVKDFMDFTFNLPSSLRAGICADFTDGTYAGSQSWYFTKNSGLCDFNAGFIDFRTVLFAMNIQKGNGILFLSDFAADFIYRAGFSYSANGEDFKIRRFWEKLQQLGGDVPLEQYFALRLVLGITPNYGVLAQNIYRTDFYVEYGTNLCRSICESCVKIGFSLKL